MLIPVFSSMLGTLFCGGAVGVLQELPDKMVNCCVTSPPYFGLRDYGVEGQIGLEDTPDEYVRRLVEVFREVRRVLRDDGTLWLNLGDSYAAQQGQRKTTDKAGDKQRSNAGSPGVPSRCVPGLKPKDLIGIPWRVAFALQADGWYLRQDLIWHKPNPMPESVTDHCTKAHEYIFLLSKSPRYYYDSEAIREDALNTPGGRLTRAKAGGKGLRGDVPSGISQEGKGLDLVGEVAKRNRRSVWTVTPKPYKEAHFATYPPDLIEPCILAGCPEYGMVLDPFMGSGTTALVAERNNRCWIGAELNTAYCELVPGRLGGVS